jgi:phage/plasmid-like protein (TIGR03299 family)
MGIFASDFSQNRAGIAYRGEANDVWHRLGASRKNDQTTREEWLRDAGLNWHAVKAPVRYDFNGSLRTADDLCLMIRHDTGAVLGRQVVTDVYQAVQPSESYDFQDQFCGIDERFKHDVMGCFKGGSIVWGSALYRDELTIANEPHIMRLLFSTTFDGSGATRVQSCVTRPLCDNMIAMAHTEHSGAVISVRHNTPFNRERVGKQLAGLVAATTRYKAMGDAMQSVIMSKEDVSKLFKTLLEIPFEAKADDISTRKMNQFRALSTAFTTTQRERNSVEIDAWTALQAVTRYVDHDRVSINGDRGEKQFLSANFGSGDAMKGHAMALLMPMIKDKIAA